MANKLTFTAPEITVTPEARTFQEYLDNLDPARKKALLDQQTYLAPVGSPNSPRDMLQTFQPSATQTMLTDPLANLLQSMGKNPYYANDTARKVSDITSWSPAGVPLMMGEAGQITGSNAAENDWLGTGGGLALGALGINPITRRVGSVASHAADTILGKFKTTTPRNILKETKAGGYSVNMLTGEKPPQDSLMMGIYANESPKNTVTKKVTLQDIVNQANKNEKALSQPNNYYGTWTDPEDLTTYLDVSKRFPQKDLRGAVKFGERTNQKAGYDVMNDKTFDVGNHAAFIRSPEYADRLNELNTVGANYLKEHPTVNWWDLKGTELEKIYGKENMDKLAGYLAATSPVSDVPRNARIASEYMRRMIAGEEIIQPQFRMPATAVFEQAGNKMPMERGRVKNLIAATEGRLNDMNKEKVRNMALALTGDPRAVVLDRHYANLSEKPSANIFTGVKKGVMPTGKPYADLKEVISNHADLLGISPRDFSANVWTGYRHKAQTEGSVFGEKTAGKGIKGESKSITDTYMDLIDQKAQKLNIPKSELIDRLKKGTMSLVQLEQAAPTSLLG